MEELLYKVLICFLAGAGAGMGIGFAGMSAATVISPMLITFCIFLLTMPSVSPLAAMCWPAPPARIPMRRIKAPISEMDW